MNVLVILVVLAAVYGAAGWMSAHWGLKGLVCSRSFSRSTVFEGETGEMIEVVRNDRPMMIPWLRIESQISPYLQLGRQENLRVSGSRYYRSLFTLMPYQQVKRRHKVRFLHRGVYDLGSASLTVGDVLGWFQQCREQHMHVPVMVYPRLLEERELPEPLSLKLGEMISRRQLLADPFQVRGIRAYVPGDPVRDIHWAASARMGETQVRVFDHTAQANLLVVLNVERTNAQWGEKLMEYEESEIEYGIAMAATLCVRALRAGLQAGFAANMPMDKGQTSTILLPVNGPQREEELLSAFARLSIFRTVSFPVFLESLHDVENMDILVLSCYENEAIQEKLASLRRKGNQVTLYLINPGRAEGGVACG